MDGIHLIKEIFAIPCVGAIIEKLISNEKYSLIQTRHYFKYFPLRSRGDLIKATNETENVHWIRAVELR